MGLFDFFRRKREEKMNRENAQNDESLSLTTHDSSRAPFAVQIEQPQQKKKIKELGVYIKNGIRYHSYEERNG